MTYRRRKRTDRNQDEIVAALKGAGCSVIKLGSVGGGCPDLLVGYAGGSCSVNMLLEVKDGAAFPSDRKLTPQESEFFETWPGPAAVVLSSAAAVSAVLQAAGTECDCSLRASGCHKIGCVMYAGC